MKLLTQSHQYLNYFEAEEMIARALHCLETRIRYSSERLNQSQDVRAYLRLHLAEEVNEVFSVLFLNNQNRLIAFEKIFFGTINQTAIYPRVVLQKALKHNAAAIILAHNHPSGECMPSMADKEVTKTLQKILHIVDVAVIDHVIVSHQKSYSFAEHGLM